MIFDGVHYSDVIMSGIASQITSLTIVYSTVYSDADQRKHPSSASLALVWGFHRGPVNSPHKWPVTRKMFPFDDVIMGVYSVTARTVFNLNFIPLTLCHLVPRFLPWDHICAYCLPRAAPDSHPENQAYILLHQMPFIFICNIYHWCTCPHAWCTLSAYIALY